MRKGEAPSTEGNAGGSGAPRMTVSADDFRRVRAHRGDVVRRLLDRGLTLRALETMLPGWADEVPPTDTADTVGR